MKHLCYSCKIYKDCHHGQTSAGIIAGCPHYEKLVVTNADRIRAMSDEELATRLAHLTDCVWCPCPDPHDQCDTIDGSCKKQWLDWLKKEVTT